MKVLITGNKGYIGTVLSKALLAQRVEVVGLDTGYYDGCNFLDDSCRIRQIAKDIVNHFEERLKALEGKPVRFGRTSDMYIIGIEFPPNEGNQDMVKRVPPYPQIPPNLAF